MFRKMTFLSLAALPVTPSETEASGVAHVRYHSGGHGGSAAGYERRW